VSLSLASLTANSVLNFLWQYISNELSFSEQGSVWSERQVANIHRLDDIISQNKIRLGSSASRVSWLIAVTSILSSASEETRGLELIIGFIQRLRLITRNNSLTDLRRHSLSHYNYNRKVFCYFTSRFQLVATDCNSKTADHRYLLRTFTICTGHAVA
jgi:hypothetical protein